MHVVKRSIKRIRSRKRFISEAGEEEHIRIAGARRSGAVEIIRVLRRSNTRAKSLCTRSYLAGSCQRTPCLTLVKDWWANIEHWHPNTPHGNNLCFVSSLSCTSSTFPWVKWSKTLELTVFLAFVKANLQKHLVRGDFYEKFDKEHAFLTIHDAVLAALRHQPHCSWSWSSTLPCFPSPPSKKQLLPSVRLEKLWERECFSSENSGLTVIVIILINNPEIYTISTET